MAASATTQPDHHKRAGEDHHPRGRRALLSHLHIQVPAVPANSGWFGRSSGPASAPCGAHASTGQDRPGSPSLLRSPSAWIRSKGHSFGSSKHTPRRSGNFHYDARSYAQNFDEGGGRDDALNYYRCFSPTPPQLASPSGSGPSIGDDNGNGNGKEPETGRIME